MTDFEKAAEYIADIPRFAPKTGLDNTRIILERLGNPERAAKVVHVAGTNGKGSVSKMIALMLEKKGYKTGLFVSPHLIRINERMTINGSQISDADFTDIFDRVKKLTDILVKEREDFQHPAYFEFLFIMAALYFKEQDCDYVVFETGLGGRLDATNVTSPEVSIITSIGLDHMQYLGDTIEEIAGEKAGIIKPGVPVVYNTGSDVADRVIESTAKNRKCSMVRVESISGGQDDSDVKPVVWDFLHEIFGDRQPLYQYDNASTAIAAFMTLEGCVFFDEVRETVREALSSFAWPGRMHFVSPNVIIDGAHNEDAIEKMTESISVIQKNRGWKEVNIFFAVSSDKDYETIIKMLCQRLTIGSVYVTEINSARREDIGEIMKLFQKYLPAEKHFEVVGSTDMEKLWETAKGELLEDTFLLAVGSLYMAGELLEYEGGLSSDK